MAPAYATRQIIEAHGRQWELLNHTRTLAVGDVVVFGNQRNLETYGDDDQYRWRVTDPNHGISGIEGYFTIENLDSGATTHTPKDSREIARLVTVKTRGRNTMSEIEKLWKLVEKTASELGATAESEHRMMLYGPPGTGKTRLAVKHGLKRGQGVFNVYLTEETSAAELRGHYIPAGDGIWNWHHGPGILAAIEPKRLVINEINNASGDCLDLLLAICDDFEMFQFTLPTGETVTAKPGYQIIATMNGEPDDLPPALQDRFVIRAKLTEPHPDAIKRLPPDIREAVLQKIGGADSRFTSIRSWLAFDRLRNSSLTEEEAALMVFESAGKGIVEALKIQRGGKLFKAPGAKRAPAKRKPSAGRGMVEATAELTIKAK